MQKILFFFEIFSTCFVGCAKFCEICCQEYEGLLCPGFVLGYHRETEGRFNISVTGTKFFQEAENFYKQKKMQLGELEEVLKETQNRLQKNPMALPVFQTYQQVILEETEKLEEAYKRLNALCREEHSCDYKDYLNNGDLIEFE